MCVCVSVCEKERDENSNGAMKKYDEIERKEKRCIDTYIRIYIYASRRKSQIM